MNKLTRMIKRHEGTGPIKRGRFFPYKDSVGKWTIGWGRNITDVGIRREVAEFLLEKDIEDATKDLIDRYPWFVALDPVRSDVIVDMSFNLGIYRFSKFKKLQRAIRKYDWKEAKKEMLDSKWARQVGQRATELSEMILTGEYQR